MSKDLKNKISFGIFLLFLAVGGFTSNFYNSMPIIFRRISLIVSALLLTIVVVFLLIEKSKK
ncbi:hypothetical protein ACPWSR_07720 [Alloiococcus sp. CFN-8]|uniref:hypothetical protein n=1 Tax=Alloiococcus sp. CFN-8 TaxID=3416081 RepID=UPI003CF23B8F